MTPELIAMLGGGVSGFVMKMIASLAQSQASLLEGMLQKQSSADSSADAAAARDGGVIVRRTIVGTILFALVVVPFVMSFTGYGVTVSETKNFLFLSWESWKTLGGYVILPEVRQTLLAIVGFYFGSSQIK